MLEFTRAKRVTDPLDDKVKARLVGEDRRNSLSYISSGSEHSPESLPCLSELVHGFLEDDSETRSLDYESESERVESVVECTDAIENILRKTEGNNDEESYRNMLLIHVVNGVDAFSGLGLGKSVFRRRVMAYLRDLGHNAAVCKTKWESSGGLTAGNYEFIDVIRKTWNHRYFVDLDFAGEFEIARPTNQYAKLVQSLPRVFVGKSDELKRIVRTMSDAGKTSLRARGLTMPPWRKNRYMQNKWFGPYRRTTNPAPATASLSPSAMSPVPVVKCRYVGFDDDVQGRLVVRTR